MRGPRFSVRHVMLAVLAVAVILGAFEAGRRWEREQNVLPLSFDWRIAVPVHKARMQPRAAAPSLAQPGAEGRQQQ